MLKLMVATRHGGQTSMREVAMMGSKIGTMVRDDSSVVVLVERPADQGPDRWVTGIVYDHLSDVLMYGGTAGTLHREWSGGCYHGDKTEAMECMLARSLGRDCNSLERARRAMQVVVKDDGIRGYLSKHDPQALGQVCVALHNVALGTQHTVTTPEPDVGAAEHAAFAPQREEQEALASKPTTSRKERKRLFDAAVVAWATYYVNYDTTARAAADAATAAYAAIVDETDRRLNSDIIARKRVRAAARRHMRANPVTFGVQKEVG